MSVIQSHADWYRSGPLAGYMRHHRIAGSTAQMVEAAQPSGHFAYPETDDLVLVRMLSGGTHLVRNYGFGPMEGPLETGDLILAPPKAEVLVDVRDQHQFRFLSIPTAFLAPHLQSHTVDAWPFDFGRLHDGTFRNDFVAAALDRLWAEAERGDPLGRLFSDAAIGLVFLALLREARGLNPREQRKGGLAPWQARSTIEFLTEHATENIELGTLARLAKLSPFHFARAFRQTTGVPPHRYQLLLRLEQAKAFLVGTDMSIMEIALAVGYDSAQTLARLFRRELGVTPSEYRRTMRS